MLAICTTNIVIAGALFTQVVALISDVPITCSAKLDFKGVRANVTCDFGKNVQADKHHFCVLFYPVNSTDNLAGTSVLQCHWVQDEEPECRVEPGFQFDKPSTGHLTLKIVNVTRDVFGTYSCQLVPPDGRRVQTCQLQTEERQLTTTVLPSHRPSKNTENCLGWQTSTAVLTALLVIVTFLAILTRIRRYFYQRTVNENSQTDEEKEDFAGAEYHHGSDAATLIRSSPQKVDLRQRGSKNNYATTDNMHLPIASCNLLQSKRPTDLSSSHVALSEEQPTNTTGNESMNTERQSVAMSWEKENSCTASAMNSENSDQSSEDTAPKFTRKNCIPLKWKAKW